MGKIVVVDKSLVFLSCPDRIGPGDIGFGLETSDLGQPGCTIFSRLNFAT